MPYSASALNRRIAIVPETMVKPGNTSISGTTESKLPPKTNNLLNTVVAHAWGVILAKNCVHLGVIKRGHQQPPRGAKMSDVSTPMDEALHSVLTNVASIIYQSNIKVG
ncbi:MAG: hypothetical protein NTX46_01915 [Chloroflexi bacterium]|nr:hypothetical protein [Chloroflexota bacterium]